MDRSRPSISPNSSALASRDQDEHAGRFEADGDVMKNPRFLPPHPGPLPQGEGAMLDRPRLNQVLQSSDRVRSSDHQKLERSSRLSEFTARDLTLSLSPRERAGAREIGRAS